jgi:hypothetical protein
LTHGNLGTPLGINLVMPAFTVEQILALAPDEASIKAGRGLASPPKWKVLQFSEAAAWGECQGSGKDPYLTSVDFSGPAFKCSCPSRKFPCKHGLGLMLLLVDKSGSFQKSEPPAWVVERLNKRQEAAERKQAKTDHSKYQSPEDLEKKEKARVKRQAGREQNVLAAMDDLDLWLDDLIRQGLAAARERPVRSYESVASRMVDQQAPGLARRVRDCRTLANSGGERADLLLEELGLLRLLSKGYRRAEVLSPELRADLRSTIGWTIQESEVIDQGEKVNDHWSVIGQHLEEVEKIKMQRTWLWGHESKRPAMVLDFAAGTQPLDISLVVGQAFSGEVAFFPSSTPLRASVVGKQDVPFSFDRLSGHAHVAEALDTAAAIIAHNPWLDQVPLGFQECRIRHEGKQWWITDSRNEALPIRPLFRDPWQLAALDGGWGLALFGEWDCRSYLPLSAWTDGRFVNFTTKGGLS